MEVIVDDSQLSLAIGKKGQNVRLAAKLLGWRIDIKTEEEKRQEVQAAMDSLSSGAPVSVLLEHGLPESVLELLVGAGVGTVERLGGMTPEELEAIPEIGADTVQTIGTVVNSYYTQLDQPAPPIAEAKLPDEANLTAEPAVETEEKLPDEPNLPLEVPAEEAKVPDEPNLSSVQETSPETPDSGESDTMKTSGSPVEE